MTKLVKPGFLFFLMTIFLLNTGCNQSGNTMAQGNSQSSQKSVKQIKTTGKDKNVKATFIELGSVRCIPCQKMQPVMKSVEEKFKGQVKVIFYDVWTEQGKPYASKYRINVIPTQVFLDKKGKEFFRHEGFFPEEELIKILKEKGVH